MLDILRSLSLIHCMAETATPEIQPDVGQEEKTGSKSELDPDRRGPRPRLAGDLLERSHQSDGIRDARFSGGVRLESAEGGVAHVAGS